MRVGFGEAGANVIAKNLAESSGNINNNNNNNNNNNSNIYIYNNICHLYRII